MKFVRWKYVLPKLSIVLTVVLLLHFGLGPLLKWTLVASGEAAIGAKIELAEVKTSLANGEIVLSGLAIANPNFPLQNLLQADRAHLRLDLNALAHNRLVIQDGVVSGLQFDTDRATSGELAKTSEEDGGPSALSPWLNKSNELAEQWFDQLSNRLDYDFVEQLKTPRVVKNLENRWPKQYEQMRGQIKELQTDIKELETNGLEVRKNPLRNLDRVGQLQKQFASIQSEMQSLLQQIEQIPQQAKDDQQAVLAARKQDEQFIRQKLNIDDLNGEGLSEMLLGDTINRRLASATDWIRWARRQVPTRSAKTQAVCGRGTTVLFGEAQPRYLVERLQLEGLASLDGKPVKLVGSLTSATSEPHLTAEPMRLSLQSSGAGGFSVEATVDRREAVAVDRLHIECPQLAMSGHMIGSADKLAILVAPNTASVRIDLTLTDDSLAGEIAFSQSSVQLTLSARRTKSMNLAAALEQALAGVKQVEAHVVLAGTLQKPEISLRSDLGSQLAAGLNNAIEHLVQQRSQALLAETQEKVDHQLQRLIQARQEARQELLSYLGKHQELLEQLAVLTGGGEPGLPTAQLSQSIRFGLRK